MHESERTDQHNPETTLSHSQGAFCNSNLSKGDSLANDQDKVTTYKDIDGWISRYPITLDGSSYKSEHKAVDWTLQTIAYRPDTILDGWECDSYAIRVASLRGKSHRSDGTPRQDDVSAKLSDDSSAVIIAVADGVSSATHSHIASTVATRYITQCLGQLLNEQQRSLPLSIDWHCLMSHTSEELIRQAERIEPGIGRNASKILEKLATTLICAVVLPTEERGTLQVESAVVGDSGSWILDSDGITSLSGGKNMTSQILYENATFCLPAAEPILQTHSFRITKHQILLIGTDGFGDTLGGGQTYVGDLYKSVLCSRIPSIIEFGHLLDFTLKSFTDDRTLIAVWPKE